MMQRGIETFISQHPSTFQRRIRRGVPTQFRWEVWKAAVKFNSSPLTLQSTKDRYTFLYERQNCWSHLISIDTTRTFVAHTDFASDQQAALQRILNAYANLNPDVGYCQGMNFIAGLLLIVSKSEYEAFWMFVHLMEDGKLNAFYMEKFPLLHRYLRAFDLLMEETLPELREHFIAENVHPVVYLHQWFLTLLINCLPFQTVLLIWDVIMCDGPPIMLAITVAILKVLKNVLIKMDFESIVVFLRTIRAGDADTDAALIGRLLIKESDSIDIPAHILQELRNSDLNKHSFEDMHATSERITSSQVMSKEWPLMIIPEDSRLETYHDFI